MKTTTTKMFLPVTLLFCLLFSACQKDEFSGLPKDEFSADDQKKIGLLLKDAFLQTQQGNILISHNKCSETYTQNILNTLVERNMITNGKNFHWEVIILADANKQHAFTLPGGYVFITKGLIDAMENESEFVAVVAHQMAYADQNYVMEKLLSTYGNQTLTDLLLNKISDAKKIAIARALTKATYPQETVRDVDVFSSKMLCPYAYKATAFADFIERISPKPQTAEWLTSHPNYPERAKFIRSYANQACCHGEKTFTERFVAFKEDCINISITE